MTGSHRLKSASGECNLRVQETHTRDAIITDTTPCRTIAYMSIGAESWGPLLAEAPELLELVKWMVKKIDAYPIGVDESKWMHRARAAIAKTECYTSAKGVSK